MIVGFFGKIRAVWWCLHIPTWNSSTNCAWKTCSTPPTFALYSPSRFSASNISQQVKSYKCDGWHTCEPKIGRNYLSCSIRDAFWPGNAGKSIRNQFNIWSELVPQDCRAFCSCMSPEMPGKLKRPCFERGIDFVVETDVIPLNLLKTKVVFSI